MVFNELQGAVVDLLHDGLHFFIHQFRRLFGIGFGQVVPPGSRGVIEGEVSHFVAHAIVLNHAVRHARKPLQVVQGAR